MGPTVAWSLAMVFVLTRLISPGFIDNEMAYSLGPMMVARPGYLMAQPFLPEMARISVVYNVLMSPVFWAFGAFWGTLLCRVLILAFQLWALSRLTRALDLAPWATLVALVLWFNTEQSLAAGELVIAGAATKPIAWGFVFLTLEALVREDWRRLPVWAGLAICFHVLVGGWTTLGLLIVLLLLRRHAIGWRGLARFGVIAGLLGLPALLPGILLLRSGDPAIAREAARISVLFANPFHQDPAFFLNPLIGLKVVVMAASAILLWRALPADPIRQLVPAFLGVLAAFFAAGLVARAIEAYGVLQYYPFRVADGLFPLFFWLGAALLFARWYERRPQVLRLLLIPIVIGLSGWLIDQTRTTPKFRGASGFTDALLTTEPRLTAFWIRSQAAHWTDRLEGRQTAFERLEQWARLNTPADAVFITPPWETTWPIASERATWISFKILAPGPSLLAWKQRFEALHGKPFTRVGFGILQQLRESYPALTAEWARALLRLGPAQYLVALTDVPGLTLVHREGNYRVYTLETP
jgi:hypothetical protein